MEWSTLEVIFGPISFCAIVVSGGPCRWLEELGVIPASQTCHHITQYYINKYLLAQTESWIGQVQRVWGIVGTVFYIAV